MIPTYIPIDFLGNGILHRAVVTLPPPLAQPGMFLQERIVFFESPDSTHNASYLQALLAAAWCVNTRDWLEHGYIYDIHSSSELKAWAHNRDPTTELFLFETGSGGMDSGAIGPERIHYAKADAVDFFVTPRVAARLHELLDVIEMLRVVEPMRRENDHE